MKVMRQVLAALTVFAVAACAGAGGGEKVAPAQAAEAPKTRQFFVVAANPLATEAGLAVLRRGGSAVDAAIAVQAMLSLVEPQSSGVGGGAFMTYFDARTGKVVIYDGRETAPAGASETMFLDDAGKALPFGQAVLSGRATGVPGVIGALGMAHREHGKLKWNSLFGDVERTAAEGFIVSPRLARMIAGNFPENSAPDVRAYFTKPDGTLMKAGDQLVNPAYAAFVKRLAKQGTAALYKGPTAERIVARTNAAPLGGSMTLADLAAYRPVKREAICGRYRVYQVCVPPPPSSGVGLLQLMAILERTDIATRGPSDPQAWFLFAEASRIMYADRDRYVGDPAFTSVPVAGMLDPAYVATRAALIGETAGPAPVAGNPAGAVVAAMDTTREPAGTSHFIVGDADGNVVSMTTTVESIFGSGRMVDGFFLNNQMTDFAMQPRDAEGRLAANAPAPGKRPRSSMTPLVLIDAEGRFAGALGSAGGNAILPYVAKSLVGAIDWNLPMQDAIALPNLIARGNAFNGEVTKFSPMLLDALQARGIRLVPGQGEDSGLHGMMWRNGRFDGGYDPRREGRAIVETAQ
ncbi:gamma-glutamyltransferase family protein [Sphingomonas sp. AOB5]|uniref:gamma-glutamyltransferase family protein n=1 Tax=Sphingomonas sp. AOB5 TaxID=3034017 RepID=UPI0023F86103|nr:gamma-glutamyltransferase family protein [Sphingomonas sp. AOB5]MDF7773696.1 gamma-glutamyltransferase family protein [Sphingomonas sp. AOB5]